MDFLDLLERIKLDYPELTFQESDHFSWNPYSNTIFHQKPISDTRRTSQDTRLSNRLLHELAHAKLNHKEYLSDASLLKIESEAWNVAKGLAKEYSVVFSIKEQDNALTSYTTWANGRSQCPACKKNGLQTLQTKFVCPNCNHNWKVGKSRFKRTYRQS
jgi:predicted RNA-binding Zn-ribbon protein involved in translation (DUF1610 family)